MVKKSKYATVIKLIEINKQLFYDCGFILDIHHPSLEYGLSK